MNFKAVIVDDDEVCLMIHKQLITISGFHPLPISFSSGELALDFFKTLQEKNDPVVLFLDINMPVLDGWDVLDEIHDNLIQTNIYVVIVSSSVEESDKIKAYSYSKVIEFIEKPFSMDALHKLMERFPELNNR